MHPKAWFRRRSVVGDSRAAQESAFLIAHDLVAKPLTLWRIMR
jgi:hypothetical protein